MTKAQRQAVVGYRKGILKIESCGDSSRDGLRRESHWAGSYDLSHIKFLKRMIRNTESR